LDSAGTNKADRIGVSLGCSSFMLLFVCWEGVLWITKKTSCRPVSVGAVLQAGPILTLKAAYWISVTADPDPILYSLTNACEPASPVFDFHLFISFENWMTQFTYI